MLNRKYLLIVIILIFVNGCARTVVTMSSSPSEAHVIINEGIHRYTPFVVNYSNAGGKLVYFSLNKDGYKEITGFITKNGEVFQDKKGMMLPSKNGYHFNLEAK